MSEARVFIWVPQLVEAALPATVRAIQAVSAPSTHRELIGAMFHEYEPAPDKAAFDDEFDEVSGQASSSAMTALLRELPIAVLARYQPGQPSIGRAGLLTVRYGRLSGCAWQNDQGYPCMSLERHFYVNGETLRLALNFASDLNELRYLEWSTRLNRRHRHQLE